MHSLGHACACVTPAQLQPNPPALLPLLHSVPLLPRGICARARELLRLRTSSAGVALRSRALNERRVVMVNSSSNDGTAETPPPPHSTSSTTTATAADSSSMLPSSPPPPILIFTVPACRYCRQAKALLASNNLAYTECSVALDNLPQAADAFAADAAAAAAAPLGSSPSSSAVVSAAEARAALAEASGMRTVPVIYVGGRLVGGYDDLEQLVSSNKLQDLLASPPDPLPPALIPLLSLKPAAASSAESEATGGAAAAAGAAGGAEGGLEMWPGESDSSRSYSPRHLLPTLHQQTQCFLPPPARRAARKHRAQRTPDLPPACPPASVVASGLRAATVGMYEEALSLDGGGVSYKRLAASDAFKEYVRAAAELQKVDVLALPRPHRKAFWINIYNSLVLHATLALGPPQSALDRKRFFSHSSYLIAGHTFSLDDIEHGILRGNRATIGLPFFPGKCPFGGSDPRRFYSLPPADPRIHFALNCGARSCPPIRLFSGDAIDSELDTAAGAFLEGDVRVVEDGRKSGGKERDGGVGCELVLEVTKLLDWYGVDFGENEEARVRWILPYLKAQVRAQVEGALATGKAVRLQFRPYDWTSNSL
ncbi:unnamed protein product [Closterium sp. Yama58-4]|nr:unnamed protein product [Closterium sp. Yama58-4]